MLIIDGVPIRRRLGSAYAHAKLADALFEIAREGLDPALAGPAAPAARAWLRVALERPITRATEAALDRFCAEFELMALDAPPHVRRALVAHDVDHDDGVARQPISAVEGQRARLSGAGRPAGGSGTQARGPGG